jgi:hypothetical protein
VGVALVSAAVGSLLTAIAAGYYSSLAALGKP